MNNEDQIREHSFDGIQEYDNQLPRWWVWTFLITILFGIWYVWDRQIIGENKGLFEQYEIARKNYELQQRILAKQTKFPDENELQAFAANESILNDGKQLFERHCSSCHGAQAEGLVGPNLTDRYWLHGNTLSDISRVIIEGVPENGMIPWKNLLSTEEIVALTVYVKSLEGENIVGKGPEGDAY